MTIHITQPKNNFCEDFVYLIRVDVYLFKFFCPTYIDIFYPDGKYLSVTVEKGTN